MVRPHVVVVISTSAVVLSLLSQLVACSGDDPVVSAGPDGGDDTRGGPDTTGGGGDASSPDATGDTPDSTAPAGGVIDPTFSGTKDVRAYYYRAPVTDRNRRVYLLGEHPHCIPTGLTDVVLARLDAQGAVDPTFGTNSRVCLNTYADAPTGDFFEVPGAMAIDASDHLYVAGSSLDNRTPSTGTRVFLARLSLDGQLDTSFGAGKGFVRFADVAEGHASSIVIVGQGIWLAGRAKNGGGMLIALDLNGALVKTFNTNVGLVVDPNVDSFSSVAVKEGNPYVTITGGAKAGDFFVRKYLPTGTVDSAFGNGGTATVAVSPGFDEARSVSVTSDGHVVVAGAGQAPSAGQPGRLAVVRLDSKGAVDPAFPTFLSGAVQWPTSADARAFLQSDGKLVAPAVVPSGRDLAVVRIGTDGKLDPTYGKAGTVASGSPKDDVTVAIGVDTSGGTIAIADDGDTVEEQFPQQKVTLKRPVVYRISP
ncbi:fibronectin type III domain protein [Labilithrix luteola]|uniref:Fibronectin type III domain protein n=1 Tax=Labilithrix luteola TaxID=1391654 RepID=A0A0K1PKW4_9BACT|nr:hypothetical protein [Labilithrix luteola]AKU94162.1 fibronectin type III domain protein [Labilithrix luteola]